MKDNRLNEKVIGSANVIVDILPKGLCIPNVKITPTSITIHNTGNINASAKNNHRYQKNNNKSKIGATASWHFTVGYDEIYQAQSTNYKCYHAGCTSGNNTSIGIEICLYSDKEKQKQAYLNAIELVKILLKYYGWGVDKVKRHYDWTKKNCPQYLLEGKYGYTWNWFKEQCKGGTQQETTEFKKYLVRCNTDGLNCRKGAGTSYAIDRVINKGTVVTIVEEKMNGKTKWLRTLSNYWISAKYVDFVRYA